jgi:hypothetical protein
VKIDSDWERRASLLKRLLPPLLFLPIIVLFYWKFTLSGQYELMWGVDQATQILPWLNVAGRQWHAGILPLWDPHMWGGQPLLGQAQPGAAYFLNWLLYSMPMKNGVFSSDIVHWYMAVIHFMAAVFCYALCRDLRRSVPASMLAGLTYSLTSYMAATGWPQMINGAVWAPLVFLFLIRAVEKRDPLPNAALSGLCLGLAWLSGHHQIPLFLSLSSGITWCFYAFRARRVDTSILRYAAVAFVICGLIGALQILPAREYGIHSLRWVIDGEPVGWDVKVPYSAHENLSMTPTSFLGIVFPGISTISEPFVGFSAFTLAMLAVLTRWREPRVRLFTFLGIGAFLYAFGVNTGIEGIVYTLIPMMEKARTPGAAIFLFALSACVLAAYGLDILGRRVTRPYLRRAVHILLATAVFVLAAMFVFVVTRIGAHQALTMAGIYALLMAALIAGLLSKAIRYRHAVLFCALLTLMEATSVMHLPANKAQADVMQFLNSVRSHREAADFLHKQQPPFRIFIAGEGIPGNWAAQHDLDGITGYLASLTVNIRSVTMYKRNLQLLWGARYALADGPEIESDVEAFHASTGRKVYLRGEAFPRSWVVHAIDRKDTREQINDQADKSLALFASKAFMTANPPAVDNCAGSETAEYRRPTGDSVVVKATLACKGMVIVSDTFFPGWKADVDGQPAEIHEVNGAMRGVVVPAGQHTVTMKYRPLSVYLGALLTLLGISAVVGIRFVKNRG